MSFLVMGSLNYDYIYSLDHIVAPGETWTLDGEFGGRHTEIVIENQKQALHIMVPGEENEAQ